MEARATVAARGGAAEADIFTAHALLLDDAAITEPALRQHRGGCRRRAGMAGGRGRGRGGVPRARRSLPARAGRRRRGRLPPGARPARRRAVRRDARGPGHRRRRRADTGRGGRPRSRQAWAIATARGGATGHAAILARALGIPAVVGRRRRRCSTIAEGTPLVVDGEAGAVDVDPGDDAVAEHRARRRGGRGRAPRRAGPRRRAGRPARRPARRGLRQRRQPRRGAPRRRAGRRGHRPAAHRVPLPRPRRRRPTRTSRSRSCARSPARWTAARWWSARSTPGLTSRCRSCARSRSRTRSSDAAASGSSLAEPDLLRTQLRAILRVAAEHPLKVMFPMVATLEELRAARALLDEARGRLGEPRRARGRSHGRGAGARPAGRARSLRRSTSSRSGRTTSPSTRWPPIVATRRWPACWTASPAPVLALVAAVIEAAVAHGRWVGVCGELAGDPRRPSCSPGSACVSSAWPRAGSRPSRPRCARRDSEAAAAAARRALGQGGRGPAAPNGAR